MHQKMETFSCLVGGAQILKPASLKSFLTHLKNPKKTQSYRGKKQTNKKTHFHGFIPNLDDFSRQNRLYQNTDGSQLSLNSSFF